MKLLFKLLYVLLKTPYKLDNEIVWRMSKPKTETRTIKFENYSMLVNANDDGLGRDLYLNKNREDQAQTLLSSLNKGDMVLDIGANIGFYVLKEHSLVGDAGKIYAIEPVSHNKELLDKNVKHLKNVKTMQLAIGDRNEQKEIYVYKKKNWSGFQKHEGEIETTETIQTVTLDTLIKQLAILPDFIRCDIEGYEYQLVKGAKETLNNPSPKFMIEVHPHLLTNEQSTEFLKTFKGAGYEIQALAIDNIFYPDVEYEDPVYPMLLWLWKQHSQYAIKGNPLLDGIGKVRTDIKINDLLQNKAFLSGKCPAFHLLLVNTHV